MQHMVQRSHIWQLSTQHGAPAVIAEPASKGVNLSPKVLVGEKGQDAANALRQ